MLKVGATDLVLRLIEGGVHLRDLALDNPIRAIREISHDQSGLAPVTLATGQVMTAVDIQGIYLDRVRGYLDIHGASETDRKVIDLWERGLNALKTGDLSAVERELDWVIKLGLIERYRAKHGLSLGDPRVARLDLAYHDISRTHGLHAMLESRGLVDRVTTDIEILESTAVPPATTRARLRGEFVRAAQEARRDYTVDWVHLKLNDQVPRTVMCKDPFVNIDERVERLIASM